jgi:hypothetical protein
MNGPDATGGYSGGKSAGEIGPPPRMSSGTVRPTDRLARVQAERDEIAEELRQARGRLLSALNIDWSDAPTADLVDDLCAMGGVTPHPFPHQSICRWCARDIHKPSAEIGWSVWRDHADNGCALAPRSMWPDGEHAPTALRSPNGPMPDPVLLCRCSGTVIHEVGDAEANCTLAGLVAELARTADANPRRADDAASSDSR